MIKDNFVRFEAGYRFLIRNRKRFCGISLHFKLIGKVKLSGMITWHFLLKVQCGETEALLSDQFLDQELSSDLLITRNTSNLYKIISSYPIN